MRIKELHISEFGGLKDRRIALGDGLTLIGGANESGKSTLLLFIKFMLYGLSKRKAGDDGEHDRSVSWQGHLAAGSMVIETEKGCFRLERRHTESGGKKKESGCRVTDCADGSEVKLSGEPGEHFLGVPREVFESSAAIGQMRCAKIDGEKTASALGNLLIAADESVDVARICKRMDDVRVEYQHRNRQGGRLHRQALEIAELRARLDRETKQALRLNELEITLTADREMRDAVRRELKQAQDVLDQRHSAFILQRMEALEQQERDYQSKQVELTALERQTFPTGTRQSPSHVGELRWAGQAYREAKEALAQAEEAERRASQQTADPTLAALGEQVREQGGAATILTSMHQQNAAVKRKRGLGIGLLFVGLLLLVGGVAALAWLPKVAWIGLFAGGALSVALAIGLLVGGRKGANALAQAVAPYGKPITELSAYLEACEEAAKEANRQRGAEESARVARGFAEARVRQTEGTLTALLSKTVGEVSDPLEEKALREETRLTAFFQAEEELRRELEGLKRWIDGERHALAEYDEAALRATVTLDQNSVTPKALEDATRKCRFEAERLRTLEEKLERGEREKLSLQAGMGDPVALSDQLAELTERQAADRDYYEALELAIDAMKQAEESMRGNVTPELAARAGQWLRQVSDGRYTTAKTTKDLRLLMEQDGYPVSAELVSGGTRDLAYLALRLSLVQQIYREEKPPLLLDEALCQLDDARAQRTLRLLDACREEGYQILLLTCHQRESQLCHALHIPVTQLSMEETEASAVAAL